MNLIALGHRRPLTRRGCSLASAAAVAIAMTTAATTAHAATTTVLVELSETLAGDGPGGTWNKFAAQGNITGGTLVNPSGGATAITLAYAGTLNNSGNAGTANAYDNTSAVGNPSWVATTTNNLVAGDLFFTDNGTGGPGGIGQVTFTFGGLAAGQTVSLDFLGARNTTAADGFYEFSIDGGATFQGLNVLSPDGTPAGGTWTGFNTQTKSFDNLADGYTAHRYMNVSDVALTGTTLQLRARDIDTTSGNFAAMNAMRLTVTDAVPEPAAASLLAAAGGAMVARRRRWA
jgi:hypothetical protein